MHASRVRPYKYTLTHFARLFGIWLAIFDFVFSLSFHGFGLKPFRSDKCTVRCICSTYMHNKIRFRRLIAVIFAAHQDREKEGKESDANRMSKRL